MNREDELKLIEQLAGHEKAALTTFMDTLAEELGRSVTITAMNRTQDAAREYDEAHPSSTSAAKTKAIRDATLREIMGGSLYAGSLIRAAAGALAAGIRGATQHDTPEELEVPDAGGGDELGDPADQV